MVLHLAHSEISPVASQLYALQVLRQERKLSLTFLCVAELVFTAILLMAYPHGPLVNIWYHVVWLWRTCGLLPSSLATPAIQIVSLFDRYAPDI